MSSLLGAGHPMKPHRLSLTHSLVLHYGLYKKMMVSCTQTSCSSTFDSIYESKLTKSGSVNCNQFVFYWCRCSSHIKPHNMTCVDSTRKTTSTSCRRSAPTTCRASQRASTLLTWEMTGEWSVLHHTHFLVKLVKDSSVGDFSGHFQFPSLLVCFQSCVSRFVWVLFKIHRSIFTGSNTAQP